MKMNDDIEKIKINKSKGTVALFDSDMNQIAFRMFKSVSERKEIMNFWNRSYKLDEKKYCIEIKHS
jgi:hypothetical protein